MSALADLGGALGGQLVPATAFIVAAWLFDRLAAARVAPEWRAAVWWVVLARLIVPVSWTASWGLWTVSAPASAPAPVASPQSGPPWMAVLWAVGMAGFAGWVLVTTVRHRRALRRRARPASPETEALASAWCRRLGVRAAVRVVCDPAARTPYVMGLRRPILVLPAALDEAFLQPALAHELTHVRRRDLWMQGVWAVVNAVYWFHPLVWVARARAHQMRELCCDARVATLYSDRGVAYRRALLQLATRAPVPLAAAPMGHTPSAALERVESLERFRAVNHRRRAAFALVAAALVAVLLLPRAVRASADVALLRAAVADAERQLDALLTGGQDTGGLQLRYATVALIEQRSRLAHATRSNANP